MAYLDINDLIDEAREEWERLDEIKHSREWTKSQHVRDLFDKFNEISKKRQEQGRSFRKCYDYGDFTEQAPIGFLDPHESRASYPTGYKAGIHAHCDSPWNVRGYALHSGKEVDHELIKENMRWKYKHKTLNYRPARFTNYGSTVFIIDKPQLLDIIVKSGEYKMPKCAKNEVFLAMTPDFVEEYADELGDILEAVKEEGNLFDIRKWYDNGMLEKNDERPRYPKYKWNGKMPIEVVEGQLAEKLSDIITNSCGHIFGRDYSWGRVKDAKDCLNLANAFMMDNKFAIFPTVAKGRKISTKGKWIKWSKDNCVEFTGEMDDEAKAIDAKLDKLDDVLSLWESACQEFRVAILISESEFSDADFVFKKITTIGKLIGVDDYIKTYTVGVPVTDILA